MINLKKIKVELELQDIYGGDGFERVETMEEVKLERTDKTITVRKDVGVPIEREKEEKRIEEKEVDVRTFKRNEKGMPLYRLGGTHGKFWGLLKEAGYSLYQMGEQENKVTTDRVMKTVQITPQWVPLDMEDGTEMEMDELPQMLSGRSNSMIQMYFDVIPECKAEIKMTYPENYEDLIERYLELAQTMNFGNKRRGTVNVINREKIS